MGILKFGDKLLFNMTYKSATRNCPAKPREYTEKTSGHIEFNPENCILCNICGKKCPTDVIRMDKVRRTPTIDRTLYIQCGYCLDSCPKKCLSMAVEHTQPDVVKTVDLFIVPEKEPTKGPEKVEAQ